MYGTQSQETWLKAEGPDTRAGPPELERQHPWKRPAPRHSPVTFRVHMGDLRGSPVRWPNQ